MFGHTAGNTALIHTEATSRARARARAIKAVLSQYCGGERGGGIY